MRSDRTVTCLGMTVLIAGLLSGNFVHNIQAAPPAKLKRLDARIVKGPFILSDGQSLRGAGYGKTIIDAQGAENGIVIRGGSGSVISDVTVRGARGANTKSSGWRIWARTRIVQSVRRACGRGWFGSARCCRRGR